MKNSKSILKISYIFTPEITSKNFISEKEEDFMLLFSTCCFLKKYFHFLIIILW
jgi:hypothetical protein